MFSYVCMFVLVCSSEWHEYQGGCYMLMDIQKTRHECKAACRNNDSLLATIADYQEMKFLESL